MRRNQAWLALILFSALALRTYHLAYPAWDYHNWRQTITLMVARDFARHNFSLLNPQVSWIGRQAADPSYFSAEFSIQSILAALLYKIFGESDTLARLVVIAFSLLGIYSLYNLLERRAGPVAARLGAVIYAFLPYHLFFGRVFMPDIPALSLALAGLNQLDRWTDDRSFSRLLAAATLTGLAILQKVTVAFVGLPALYLFWLAYDSNLLRRREPYIFALIALLPELAWYAHAIAMTPQSVLSAVNMQRSQFGRYLDLWFQERFALPIFKALSREAFSPLGLGLAFIGLFFAPRSRVVWIFRLWLVGAALLLLLIPTVVGSNLYYLSLLLPGGAALGGLALAELGRFRKGNFVVPVVAVVFLVGAIASTLPLFQPDRLPYYLALLLRQLSAPADLLVTETGGSPNVLYYADRRGWLLARNYDTASLDRLQKAGARYYADTFPADASEHRDFFRMLETRYAHLTNEDTPWQIYDLAAQPGPAAGVQVTEPATSRVVNFGDSIELRGISLRRLLHWPATFEVIYHWRALKAPLPNLRVFVHFTDAAGKVVYQQDHWPQAGRFPTTKWARGDTVEERYILALPGSLPAARYQIRLGWFDPTGGARLPVLNQSPLDEKDRVRVAEIDVPAPPHPGWFSSE